MGNSLLSWKSKKQNTVSKSSVEDEYMSLAYIVSKLVLLLGVQTYYDNKAAIKIAANPMYHERTKHIEIDCDFIRKRL